MEAWTADLVIVRDMLFHLSTAHALKVLERVRQSGSRFLWATTFPGVEPNADLSGDLIGESHAQVSHDRSAGGHPTESGEDRTGDQPGDGRGAVGEAEAERGAPPPPVWGYRPINLDIGPYWLGDVRVELVDVPEPFLRPGPGSLPARPGLGVRVGGS